MKCSRGYSICSLSPTKGHRRPIVACLYNINILIVQIFIFFVFCSGILKATGEVPSQSPQIKEQSTVIVQTVSPATPPLTPVDFEREVQGGSNGALTVASYSGKVGSLQVEEIDKDKVLIWTSSETIKDSSDVNSGRIVSHFADFFRSPKFGSRFLIFKPLVSVLMGLRSQITPHESSQRPAGTGSFLEGLSQSKYYENDENRVEVNNTETGENIPAVIPTPRRVIRTNSVRTHRVPPMSGIALWYWFVSGLLVLFAGLASGLTVGLMSLDPVQLKVLETEGSTEEKRSIRQITDVIRRHHLLLVTLLLANSIAMETLPIFLDRLIPSWAAVLLSVTAILVFGEIIPQALCTGPNQLKIAQITAPFVSVLIGLFFVISWPIAKFLDRLLGDADHHSYYARAHLKALIRMHERDRRIREATETGDISEANSALGADEVVVIEGALDLASKTLKEIMLPIKNVFMLDVNTKLNRQTFELILRSGHSRIPVYKDHHHNIKGLLLTKSLLAVDSADEIRAGDLLVSRRPIFSSPDTNLYDLLNEFQKGHSHIAFVTNQADEYIKAFKSKTDIPSNCSLMGIATLEDVIEELIQEEIYDEFDEKNIARSTLAEHSMLSTASMTSWSGLCSSTRKPSSHLFRLKNEDSTFPDLANESTEPSSRDLPKVVKQLSQDLLPTSEKRKNKRFGPSSLTPEFFQEGMTLPLVQLPNKPGTPRNGSLLIASSPSTLSLHSKVNGLLIMDEPNEAKKSSSFQRGLTSTSLEVRNSRQT